MIILYLLIIIFGRTLQGIFYKPSSQRLPNLRWYIAFDAFEFLCASIPCLLLIVCTKSFKMDLLTLALGTMLGICMLLGGFCSLFAMKSGTVALSSMFSSAGLLIPLIAGVILFNQPISPIQWLGVALFFVSSYFLIGSSKKIYTNFSFKTFLLLLGGLIFSGLSALSQQMFSHYVPNGDVSTFTFSSFFVTSALGFVVFVCTKNTQKKADNIAKSDLKRLAFYAVCLAIALFAINQVVTILTKLISPVFLFTFANGSYTIIAALFGAVLYKEKITLQSVVGIVLGIASLVIIKMF